MIDENLSKGHAPLATLYLSGERFKIGTHETNVYIQVPENSDPVYLSPYEASLLARSLRWASKEAKRTST